MSGTGLVGDSRFGGTYFGCDKRSSKGYFEGNGIEYNVATSIGQRRTQEDAFLVAEITPESVPEWTLPISVAIFGIFDGHRNSTVSTRAASLLPGVFAKIIQPKLESIPNYDWTKLDYDRVFAELCLRLDRKLYTNIPPYCRDGGTTAAMVFFFKTDNRSGCFCAHLGDSRIYVFNNQQDLDPENTIQQNVDLQTRYTVYISSDHNPARLDEQARLQRIGALYKAGRLESSCVPGQRGYGLAMTRALGDYVYKKVSHADPDLVGPKMEPHENVVSTTPEVEYIDFGGHGISGICIFSDGINERMTDEHVLEACIKCRWDSDELVRSAAEKNTTDNMTACYIKLV